MIYMDMLLFPLLTPGAQSLRAAYLQDLVYNAPVGLHCVDEEGIILWANKAELDLMGYDFKDYIGQSIASFHVDPAKISDILARLKRNETLRGYVAPMRRKDGTVRMVSISSNVFRQDGKFIHTRCFTTDISEQVIISEALATSEIDYQELVESHQRDTVEQQARYNAMVAEIEDYAILSLDRNGYILNWNAGAEKIKGYAASEIIGKHFSVFYRQEDRLSNLPEQLITQARIHGKAVHEGPRLRKDGSLFWGSIVITAVHNSHDQLIGFTKVTRDLTESRRKEEQIKEYAAVLEQQNRELEQFAYAASHDLKEPLRKIQFYVQAVAENAAPLLDEKNSTYLERAAKAGRRMQKLIDDILEYTHLGATDSRAESIDVCNIVREFADMNEEEIRDQQVNISCTGNADVRGVTFQIRQLLHNLLGNALKYRHPERRLTIHVAVNTVPGTSVPFSEANGATPYAVISVKDNGSGFDAAYSSKIFEIFHRLHSKEASGSGIGLAICKKIVQHHQGFITATAAINEGATFTVYLPAQLS